MNENEYPQLELQSLDDALGGVQFFPRDTRSAMAMGHALVQYTETDKWAFDDAVAHWADYYAKTTNVQPEWVAGAVYVRNAFGVLHGPLNTSADDPEACVAEAIEAFGYENVVDKRPVTTTAQV